MKKKQNEKMPQGEGNRAADRRYREGVEKTLRSGKVPEKAEEARREFEREELRHPKQAQKPRSSESRHPKPRPSDIE